MIKTFFRTHSLKLFKLSLALILAQIILGIVQYFTFVTLTSDFLLNLLVLLVLLSTVYVHHQIYKRLGTFSVVKGFIELCILFVLRLSVYLSWLVPRPGYTFSNQYFNEFIFRTPAMFYILLLGIIHLLLLLKIFALKDLKGSIKLFYYITSMIGAAVIFVMCIGPFFLIPKSIQYSFKMFSPNGQMYEGWFTDVGGTSAMRCGIFTFDPHYVLFARRTEVYKDMNYFVKANLDEMETACWWGKV
jgi:hypothetical protein